MKPRGATELQMEMLEKHVSKELLDQVQICTSIPGKVPLDPNKLNILWQKNSWDQPNLYPWFKNKANHHKYDWYVFNFLFKSQDNQRQQHSMRAKTFDRIQTRTT